MIINRKELIKLYEEIGLNVLDNNTVMNSSNKKICNFLVNVIEQRVIDGKMYLYINALGINGEILPDVILDSYNINRNTWVTDNFGFKYSIDKKYINDLKLAKSKLLIKENKYTISEIAFMLGFSSIHYFSRSFTQHFEISPSEYAQTVFKS